MTRSPRRPGDDINGEWVHNRAELHPVRVALSGPGRRVVPEQPVVVGQSRRRVDLCADLTNPTGRVVVEADGADGRRTRLRADRVAAYVAKAEALAADVLLIVVRTGRIAAQGRRYLRHLPPPTEGLDVVVCTGPQAVALIQRRWGRNETQDPRPSSGTRFDVRVKEEKNTGDKNGSGRERVVVGEKGEGGD